MKGLEVAARSEQGHGDEGVRGPEGELIPRRRNLVLVDSTSLAQEA